MSILAADKSLPVYSSGPHRLRPCCRDRQLEELEFRSCSWALGNRGTEGTHRRLACRSNWLTGCLIANGPVGRWVGRGGTWGATIFSTKQKLEVWKPVILSSIHIFNSYTYATLYICKRFCQKIMGIHLIPLIQCRPAPVLGAAGGRVRREERARVTASGRCGWLA